MWHPVLIDPQTVFASPGGDQVSEMTESGQRRPTERREGQGACPQSLAHTPGPAGGHGSAPARPSPSDGAQNDMRYPVLPGRHRLAVARGEAIAVYGNDSHQDATRTGGDTRPPGLPDRDRMAHPDDCADAACGSGAAPVPPADPLILIERLAELRARGILTDAEFAQKKAELLARI